MSDRDAGIERDPDLWALACQIAKHHAFEKHRADFNNPELGPVLNIHEVEKLAEHIYGTLSDRDTKCFRIEEGNQGGAHFAYNERTNTYIFFTVPENARVPPTAYRPDKREKWFSDKHRRASDEQQGREPEITRGIQPLMRDIRKSRGIERPRDLKEQGRTRFKAERGAKSEHGRQSKEDDGERQRQDREQERQRADLKRYLTDSDYRRKLWRREITERSTGREQQRGQTRGRDDGGTGRKR